MKRNLNSLLITGGVIFVFLLIFGSRVFKVLEPNEAGVLFKPLSSKNALDKERIYDPGLNIIAPWNRLIVFNMQEQVVEERMDVLDKKGLTVIIDVTVRFIPVKSKIGELYENFRGDYIQNLVTPEIRSAARKVFGSYEAEEIYSTKRAEVEASIITETEAKLMENNVVMKTLLIRSIKLPEKIRMAIDSKEEQRQIAEAMKYKLDKETMEAERKEIEAKGIANYNRILNASLTDKILRQKGIDVTKELSTSANAKVVVIGSGKDGLPLILGNN